MKVEREDEVFLGLYDHFYSESFFSEITSTHYINAADVIKLDANKLNLPYIQNDCYRWLTVNDLRSDSQIHCFSKVFFNDLVSKLEIKSL